MKRKTIVLLAALGALAFGCGLLSPSTPPPSTIKDPMEKQASSPTSTWQLHITPDPSQEPPPVFQSVPTAAVSITALPFENRIWNFRVLNETSDSVSFRVDYAYNGDHGSDGIFLLAVLIGNGGDVCGVSSPSGIGVGKGYADVFLRKEFRVYCNVTSQISVGFMASAYTAFGDAAFFDYRHTWE